MGGGGLVRQTPSADSTQGMPTIEYHSMVPGVRRDGQPEKTRRNMISSRRSVIPGAFIAPDCHSFASRLVALQETDHDAGGITFPTTTTVPASVLPP